MAYTTPTLRTCPDCKQETDNFSPKGWACRPCASVRSRRWVTENPEKAKRARRDYAYRTKYGISVDEYEILAGLQNHECKICGASDPERLLVVDHCHETGAVRGLLCDKCNVSIGRLGDTIESIEKVLAYMKGEL